jgi:glycosyltransferase involved in cell wall biosynthesis
MENPIFGNPSISIVISLLNEGENLPELYERQRNVILPYANCEIILINDGSTDNTLEILR